MDRRKLTETHITVMMLSVKRPRGHRLLLEFLRDLQSGALPTTSTTARLAEAFERIVFDGHDPTEVLQLKAGKGRPKQTSAAYNQRTAQHAKVLEFILKSIDEDTKKRGSTTRAVKRAATKFHKSEDVVWEIWRGRDSYLAPRRFLAALQKEQAAVVAAIAGEQASFRAAAALEKEQATFRQAYEMLAREQPVIDAYAATLSPKARAKFMEMDGRECYRIALAHQKSLGRK